MIIEENSYILSRAGVYPPLRPFRDSSILLEPGYTISVLDTLEAWERVSSLENGRMRFFDVWYIRL